MRLGASVTRMRLRYWDAVRGVAIIAVVWIHAQSGAQFEHGPAAWNFDYWIVMRQALNFAVALFFFVSGYFVRSEAVARTGRWVGHRTTRLLIPFAAWTLLYFGLSAVRVGEIGNPLSLVPRVLLGLSAPHLYFVVVLMQLVLITPFLEFAIRQRWGAALFAVTPIWVAGMYLVAFATGDLPPLYNYFFPGWFAFYFAGLWARHRGAPRLRLAAGGVVVGFALAVIEAYWLLSVGLPASFAVSQLKISSILCSFAVIALVIAIGKRGIASPPSWIVAVGERSYGVYYVHLVWIWLLSGLLSGVPILDDVLPITQIAQIAAVLLLSLGTIELVVRALGHPRAAKYLGL